MEALLIQFSDPTVTALDLWLCGAASNGRVRIAPRLGC